MRNLLLLSLLLMLLFPTITNSKPSKENNKAAIEALEQCNQLLKEEGVRWQTLHTNPVTDQWVITKNGNNLEIDVTIDTQVSNIINDKPIKRKYTLIPDNYKFWYPFDIMIGGSYIGVVGWRPTFGCGYAPLWGYGFGATVNTTLMNINAGIFYTSKYFPSGFVEATIGTTFTGVVVVGAGIGIRI